MTQPNAGLPQLVTDGGATNAAIPAGAQAGAIKKQQGYLCRVSVIAAGTAPTTFYDNALGDTSGTPLAVIPSGTTAGTVVNINMPADNGIAYSQAAGGAQLTVGYA